MCLSPQSERGKHGHKVGDIEPASHRERQRQRESLYCATSGLALASADKVISQDWSCHKCHQKAVNPLWGWIFLDLDLSLQRVTSQTGGTLSQWHHCIRVLFRPHSKQSNAYAYIPSFHGRQIFRGWMALDAGRASQASDSQDHRQNFGGRSIFYHHPRSRRCLKSFPRKSLARGHTGTGLSVICSAFFGPVRRTATRTDSST